MKSLFEQLCDRHDRAKADPEGAAKETEAVVKNFRAVFYGVGAAEPVDVITDEEMAEIEEIDAMESRMVRTEREEVNEFIEANFRAGLRR